MDICIGICEEGETKKYSHIHSYVNRVGAACMWAANKAVKALFNKFDERIEEKNKNANIIRIYSNLPVWWFEARALCGDDRRRMFIALHTCIHTSGWIVRKINFVIFLLRHFDAAWIQFQIICVEFSFHFKTIQATIAIIYICNSLLFCKNEVVEILYSAKMMFESLIFSSSYQ